MKAGSLRIILKGLTQSSVRFLIVGGLAVNVYGYLRMTVDLDLVVQLVPDNVRRAFEALTKLGYRPMVPVTAEQFGDAPTRNKWIREKGMRVLRFHSDKHWETPVDLFVKEPFPFDREWKRAARRDLPGVGGIHVVSLKTLMRMKEQAGRTQDLADLDHLRLRGARKNG